MPRVNVVQQHARQVGIVRAMYGHHEDRQTQVGWEVQLLHQGLERDMARTMMRTTVRQADMETHRETTYSGRNLQLLRFCVPSPALNRHWSMATASPRWVYSNLGKANGQLQQRSTHYSNITVRNVQFDDDGVELYFTYVHTKYEGGYQLYYFMIVNSQDFFLLLCFLTQWVSKKTNGTFRFLENSLMTLTSDYLYLDRNNDRHADVKRWIDLHLHRAQPRTSSTQQQVWAGLGAGSGLGGLGLKLSLEPRVEQGHAQEIKPGRRRHNARGLKPTWCLKPTQHRRFISFPPLENSRWDSLKQLETQRIETKPPHNSPGIVENCARADSLPAASLATITRWRDASEPARCNYDPDDTSCKTTHPGLRHTSSYLPKLGYRGQRVGDLRDTAQVSTTGHSAPCAGRRHDSCQLSEADWNGFDVRDADETDAILDLRGDANPLVDKTSQTQNGTVWFSVTTFGLIIAITRFSSIGASWVVLLRF